MSFKNRLLSLLVRAQSPFMKKREGEERFLLVSTTGLGDTLWSTAALKLLRENYPTAYIAILTSPIGKEVFANNPHAQEVFVLKRGLFSLMRLFFPLRKKGISTALILHTSQRIVLPFCHFIGATTIIGTKGMQKGLDHLLTVGIEKRKEPLHEIDRRLEILFALEGVAKGEKKRASSIHMELFLGEKKPWASQEILSQKRLVGIHPGAKDQFKRWPAACFIELGQLLKAHPDYQILLTGSLSEKALLEEIAGQMPEAKIVLDPSLESLAYEIQKMAVLITNDTGPMHIGFTLHTPTVALFSPTDPRVCGPYGEYVGKILFKPATCTPCLGKKCADPFCLLQITPREVYNAVLPFIS